MKIHYLILIVFAISVLSACTTPAKKLDRTATASGLIGQIDTSGHYAIKSYLSSNLVKKNVKDNKTVFVYFEGDGRPWDRRLGPNPDPNSHDPIALSLMIEMHKSFKQKSIYLSRPCYSIDPMPENCNENAWTSDRYSQNTVEAMNNALTRIQQQHGIEQFIFVGHSGGGTLAMLIANQRRENNDVAAVVTLAANLDHRAWTEYFNYLPLSGSLNVIEQPLLPDTIKRWHFAGKKDRAVPSQLIEVAAKRDPNAVFILYEDADHNCCWESIYKDFYEKNFE